VLSTVAFTHAETLLAERNPPEEAFTSGFQWGFWVAAFIWGAGLVAALLFIRREEVAHPQAAELPATKT
jgi:hypothetical protein